MVRGSILPIMNDPTTPSDNNNNCSSDPILDTTTSSSIEPTISHTPSPEYNNDHTAADAVATVADLELSLYDDSLKPDSQRRLVEHPYQDEPLVTPNKKTPYHHPRPWLFFGIFLALLLLTLTISIPISRHRHSTPASSSSSKDISTTNTQGSTSSSNNNDGMSSAIKTSWPEVVGMPVEEAQQLIETETQGLGMTIQVLPYDSMYTTDYDIHRIRIFMYESNQTVADIPHAPRIG